MNQITLKRDQKQGWMADFHGDRDIEALFGCTLIPTGFTAGAEASKVQNEITKLNPGYIVTVAA